MSSGGFITLGHWSNLDSPLSHLCYYSTGEGNGVWLILDKYKNLGSPCGLQWRCGWGGLFTAYKDRSDQIRSVAQLCPTLCDPMNRSTAGVPVHHQLPEFTQTHIHRVSDAIQPSHPLSSPSPLAPNPSQHSWQIDGETMETLRDFIFLGSKITADGDYSHVLKDTCSLEEKLWPI